MRLGNLLLIAPYIPMLGSSRILYVQSIGTFSNPRGYGAPHTPLNHCLGLSYVENGYTESMAILDQAWA